MRKIQARPKVPYAQPETAPVPIPAPTGGWNAIDPLANMDPKYAPILINWVPRSAWIELRAGYNAWCQGLGTEGPVETLMCYKPVSGTQFLFAACGGNLRDALKALIVANEYLEFEVCDLMQAVSHAYARGRFKTYSG